MTKDEKRDFQIEEMKKAIKKLKVSVDGINLHIAAIQRQVRALAKKK